MSNPQHTNPKIAVNEVSKIFGDAPQRALANLSPDKSREQIKDETGQLVALRDISFTVREGEIFVLMGLSGSGKSTLLRCINRLHEITSGSITVNNTDMASLTASELRAFRRTHFGMVFQHFALFPHRTVLENVTFGLEIQGVPQAQRYERGREVLETVGLSQWSNNQTGELSGGMQQRVGLARALAVDPDILLMDEPFSALDPMIRTGLQDELLRLHHEMRKTILFVTHDLNEAIKVGNRIAILNDQGKVVQIGEPEEIIMHPADDYVEAFLGDVDRPSVIRTESIMRSPRALSSPEEARQVNRLATIKEILPDVINTDNAIAVVNDDGELVGEITRSEVTRVLEHQT